MLITGADQREPFILPGFPPNKHEFTSIEITETTNQILLFDCLNRRSLHFGCKTSDCMGNISLTDRNPPQVRGGGGGDEWEAGFRPVGTNLLWRVRWHTAQEGAGEDHW